MADDEGTETKEKRTVPAMVRTARGVANHAAAVLAMQWDKERKALKDPITSTLALFTYAKLTAALLDEAETRIDARAKALEIRTEKLEQQIVAFESWRAEVTKQGEEMTKGLEEMMRGVELQGNVVETAVKIAERLGSNAAALAKTPAKTAIADTSTVDVGENGAVVPIKPVKKREEEKGGAA